MSVRTRRIAVIGAAALALAAFASHDHSATIQILAHRQGDLAPQRLQLGLNLGAVAVSVLVTWSRRLAY